MPTRTNDLTRGALNRLIAAVNDELLVLDASERIMESSSLRDILRQQSQRRWSARTDLSSALVALGGSASTSAGWRARLARALRIIPRLLAGAHQGDTVAVCARASAKTELSYWNALDSGLPTNIRSFVEPQYQQARGDAATLRRLRWGGSDTARPIPDYARPALDGVATAKVWQEEKWQDVELREVAPSPIAAPQ